MPTTCSALLRLLPAALLLCACGDDGPPASPGSTTNDDPTGPSEGSTGEAPTGSGGSEPDTGDTTGPGEGSTGDGSTGGGSTGDGTSTGGAGLEIAGEWFEQLGPGDGITHVIDQARWDQLADFGDAIFHITAYDNGERWVVAQGDAANEFFPELWSKFDWTWDGDALYYCTVAFDAPSAEEAMAAPDADPGDLELGCSGFAWSLLVPVR